ncbi:DUF3945 domain-containing protein [Chryseobacterium carnipullorum]|uniref:Uncharacterized protein n=1 Tax=Chryseobacterium carnipullorum TaxID=1124835 RepID=A0A376EFV2_CHRCU|nr:DUF3945 domain-containing protein [Chryseobacterium carnipullorum]STD07701.1 Uncharacterised protein [Chryseobacterium carnipullorum]
MENELTWIDRNITPRTGAYKNFVKEMESTSPELFFRDGERMFSDREKKFMAIYQSKGKEFIQGSNFTLKTFFNSNPDFPIEDKFNNPVELVRFIEKEQLNNKVMILQNAMKFTETIIDSEGTKHKLLSDFWAQELEIKTDLSSGLTNKQIDERQAFHYRNYERESKMLGIEVTPFNEIGIKALADKLQSHYEINEEPTWNFSNPYGFEVLKAAIEVSHMREDVKNAIFNYLQTFPPMLPERENYFDGSYDQGQSDYERALENYETKKEPEYIDKITSIEKILVENNIALDKLPVLEELEASEFKYLVKELEKYFSKEIQNIISEKRGIFNIETTKGKPANNSVKEFKAPTIIEVLDLSDAQKRFLKTTGVLHIPQKNSEDEWKVSLTIEKDGNISGVWASGEEFTVKKEDLFTERNIILNDIKVTPEQSKAISEYFEYKTGSIIPLTDEQLSKIPDVIEGRRITDFQKLELATGNLEFSNTGTEYFIKNNSIVKSQLDEDLIPVKTFLKTTDVSFDKVQVRENDIQIVGGKIKDIAAEALKNPQSLEKYDSVSQSVINKYNDTNGVETDLQVLESSHKSLLETADKWKNEIYNPTELSQGRTFSEVQEMQHYLSTLIDNSNKRINTEKSKGYIESPSEEFHLNISEIKNKPREQQKLMIPDFINRSFLSDNQRENLISGKEVTFLDKYDDLDQMLQLKDDGRISYFYPSGETGYLLNKDVKFSNARIDGLAKEALQNPLYLQNFDYTTQDIVNKYIYENTRYFPIFEKDIAIAYEPKIRQDIDISTHYVNDAKTNLETKNGDLSIDQMKNIANSLAANITFFKNNINNQNPNIMETQKEFDQVQYLKDQLKYLGFGEGEKLHKDLEKGIKSVKQQFDIKTTSDKALPENKVGFILKFNKTESGGVFLNSYNAKLTNEKGEEISHNFPVNRENTFTAKEAVNLLEGRAVKIEFQNPKTEQMEPAFVKFNFSEPKTEKGNYNFQNFYKNYGVDTANIVEKSNLIFDKPEYKENTIKSLEKGNIVKVKFELEDKVIEGKAVLNPQYKNLNLYDSDMTRINTNKPLEGLEQDNKHEKKQCERAEY